MDYKTYFPTEFSSTKGIPFPCKLRGQEFTLSREEMYNILEKRKGQNLPKAKIRFKNLDTTSTNIEPTTIELIKENSNEVEVLTICNAQSTENSIDPEMNDKDHDKKNVALKEKFPKIGEKFKISVFLENLPSSLISHIGLCDYLHCLGDLMSVKLSKDKSSAHASLLVDDPTWVMNVLNGTTIFEENEDVISAKLIEE